MNALVLTDSNGSLALREVPEPTAAPGTALVALHAAALNRRDYWITQGLYPGMTAPCTLGSDGAGVVEAVGDGVDEAWLGQEVTINPALDWGTSTRAQGEGFRILGMPDDGTFANRIRVPATQLVAKPGHLSWAEAAALPLAGLTAYRATFSQGGLQPDETVLITGVGGGVAVAALQFAVKAGARVLVTSSSPDKLERARSLGATAGFNYREDGWAEQAGSEHGPIDLVVDGAAGDGFNDLLGIVRPGGRIVSYGGTAGPPAKFDIRRHFFRQLHLIGSTMGSPEDFAAMVDFVNEHQHRPVVDTVVPLSEGAAAVASMGSSPQFGKIVLETA